MRYLSDITREFEDKLDKKTIGEIFLEINNEYAMYEDPDVSFAMHDAIYQLQVAHYEVALLDIYEQLLNNQGE